MRWHGRREGPGLGTTHPSAVAPSLLLDRAPDRPHLATQPPLKSSKLEATPSGHLCDLSTDITASYDGFLRPPQGALDPGGFISPTLQPLQRSCFLCLSCLLGRDGAGRSLPPRAKSLAFTQPGVWYVETQTGIGHLGKAP